MACLMIRTGREKLGTGSWEGWGDKERWKGEETEGIGRQAWVILLQQSNRDVAFVARRRRNPPRIQLWSLKVLSDFLPLTFSSSESFSLQVYSSESNLVVLDPIFLNCFLFVSQSISSPGRRNELEEPSVPPSPQLISRTFSPRCLDWNSLPWHVCVTSPFRVHVFKLSCHLYFFLLMRVVQRKNISLSISAEDWVFWVTARSN